MSRKRWLALATVAALAVVMASPALRWWRAGQLLMALASSEQASEQQSADLDVQDVVIDGADGPFRGRLYHLRGERGRGLVLAHGVHYQGIDERRLVPFARALARQGLVVLTPELRDLADYRVTEQGAQVLIDSVRYLEARDDLLDEDGVGLMGFSFAGGLSLLAASEPSLAHELAYVVSVGGYHDLQRVLRFLVTDRIDTPDGAKPMQAHEYGLVVVVYGLLDQFAPAADLETLRGAFSAWLQEDRERAFELRRELTTSEGAHLFHLLESGGLDELAPRLLKMMARDAGALSALSPHGKLEHIAAPVYLLHGSGDSVIPPTETTWAARELGAHDHLALITPLLTHVSLEGDTAVFDELRLLDFMAHLL